MVGVFQKACPELVDIVEAGEADSAGRRLPWSATCRHRRTWAPTRWSSAARTTRC